LFIKNEKCGEGFYMAEYGFMNSIRKRDGECQIMNNVHISNHGFGKLTNQKRKGNKNIINKIERL
jgi:hypothetical protein